MSSVGPIILPTPDDECHNTEQAVQWTISRIKNEKQDHSPAKPGTRLTTLDRVLVIHAMKFAVKFLQQSRIRSTEPKKFPAELTTAKGNSSNKINLPAVQ